MALQHECSPTNVGLVAAKLADPIVLVDIGPVVDLVFEATTRQATMVATMTKITATAIAIINKMSHISLLLFQLEFRRQNLTLPGATCVMWSTSSGVKQ